IAAVVVDSFELARERAQRPGARRREHAGGLLDRARKRERVRERTQPACALRDLERGRDAFPARQRLEPAVFPAETDVELEDGLADPREAEVTGLDDAGVDRPDRDFEHALTLDGGESEPRRPRHVAGRHEVAAQGMASARPAV